MCNQHTIVLLEIPIILWVLWTRRRTILGKELVLVTAAFLLGLLPYVGPSCAIAITIESLIQRFMLIQVFVSADCRRLESAAGIMGQRHDVRGPFPPPPSC